MNKILILCVLLMVSVMWLGISLTGYHLLFDTPDMFWRGLGAAWAVLGGVYATISWFGRMG